MGLKQSKYKVAQCYLGMCEDSVHSVLVIFNVCTDGAAQLRPFPPIFHSSPTFEPWTLDTFCSELLTSDTLLMACVSCPELSDETSIHVRSK